MQESSYAEKIHPRLHIYPSEESDRLKRELLASGDMATLENIGRLLFGSVNVSPIVPVFVLRGGLVLWQPFRETIRIGPMGLIAPTRERHEDLPRIAYASVPHVKNGSYALLDVIVASGRTMDACLSWIYDRFSAARVDIVAPFVSEPGRDYLLSRFATTHIHCVWHAERVDRDGRMIGPGFDIGDRALHWTKVHRTWTAEGPEGA